MHHRFKHYANMMLSLLGIIPDANYPRVDKDRRAYSTAQNVPYPNGMEHKDGYYRRYDTD